MSMKSNAIPSNPELVYDKSKAGRGGVPVSAEIERLFCSHLQAVQNAEKELRQLCDELTWATSPLVRKLELRTRGRGSRLMFSSRMAQLFHSQVQELSDDAMRLRVKFERAYGSLHAVSLWVEDNEEPDGAHHD